MTLLPQVAAAVSDSTNATKYVIKAAKIQGDISLTGKLSDPRWAHASPVHLGFEVQPGDNLPATQRTDVRVLYNDETLYLGFMCHDTDPSRIRAHIADRDNMFDDDYVGVILDTYSDHQRAYEFFANPYGIQGDGIRDANNEDMSWDAVWHTASSIIDSGYIVEMAIPFKSIRFPALPIENWNLDFLRNLPRQSRYQYSWVRLDLNDPCLLCQGGTLEGLTSIDPAGTFGLLPYAMALKSDGKSDPSDPNSSFSNGRVTGRLGLGIQYNPNPSLTIEGVGNPDFSQVESDAAQISVNSSFALFYPEKRPFFMEGNDLLTTKTQAYYSRMINNPLGGMKLMENSGGFSLGYIGAEDRNTPFIVAGEEASSTLASSHQSVSNILRGKYNFGNQSFVGFLGTARNFYNAHNYVEGVDWNYFFSGNYTFDGQVLYSNTKELNDTNLISDTSHFGSTRFTRAFDGEEYGGMGSVVEFRRDARIYSFRLTYRDFSPTFQAQNGFVFQNDLRTLDMDHNVEFYPNTALIDWWVFDVESFLHFNYDNKRKERWIVPTVVAQLKGQTQLQATYLLLNDELFRSVDFRGVHRWIFNMYARPFSAVTCSLNVQTGRFIYRADTARLGTGYNISAELVLKPTDRLSLTADYSVSKLLDIVGGTLFYDGYIGRLSTIYQINKRIFIRLIGQYDQFNQAIEIDPLFSYKLNPFTIFYAGSTHSLTDYGEPFGIEQTSREFFIKLQYLLRD